MVSQSTVTVSELCNGVVSLYGAIGVEYTQSLATITSNYIAHLWTSGAANNIDFRLLAETCRTGAHIVGNYSLNNGVQMP